MEIRCERTDEQCEIKHKCLPSVKCIEITTLNCCTFRNKISFYREKEPRTRMRKKRSEKQHDNIKQIIHRKLQYTIHKKITLKMIRFAKRLLSSSSLPDCVCVLLFSFVFRSFTVHCCCCSRASHVLYLILVVFIHFAAIPIRIVMPCHTIPFRSVPYTSYCSCIPSDVVHTICDLFAFNFTNAESQSDGVVLLFLPPLPSLPSRCRCPCFGPQVSVLINLLRQPALATTLTNWDYVQLYQIHYLISV